MHGSCKQSMPSMCVSFKPDFNYGFCEHYIEGVSALASQATH